MFFMYVILPIIVIVAVVVLLVVIGDQAEKKQAKKDAETHPVNIRDIPLFVSLLGLAEKGQLHNYILTPHMLYFNFDVTHYKDSDGKYRGTCASSVGGTLIDFAKSGYQIMIPPIHRQCVRQLEAALKELPNVVKVDRYFRTEISFADSRFIDENGQYCTNGKKLEFDCFSVTYKVMESVTGKSWS